MIQRAQTNELGQDGSFTKCVSFPEPFLAYWQITKITAVNSRISTSITYNVFIFRTNTIFKPTEPSSENSYETRLWDTINIKSESFIRFWKSSNAAEIDTIYYSILSRNLTWRLAILFTYRLEAGKTISVAREGS